MILSVSSHGTLFCVFNTEDVRKYFSMSFEEFLEDQKTIERFSDILIKKAIKMGKMDALEGEVHNVTLYQVEEERYAICIEKTDVNMCGA